MSITASSMRRGLFWVLTTSALGGAAVAVWVLPNATAAINPCAASEIARTIGSVSTSTGNYLDSHPETNMALTNAAQQQPPQALAALKTYFDANPQAGKDIATISQPLTNLSTQCRLPISIPQALQMMQGMAQGGQQPGGLTLPGATPSPLNATMPGATTGAPAGTSVAPAGTGATPAGTGAMPAATGPLPGPAATALR
jgi:heme-binding protein